MKKQKRLRLEALSHADLPQVAPELYDAWIRHVFDRPADDPGWYFDSSTGSTTFDASDEEVAALFIQTMMRSGQDLKVFSDEQVSHGLNYMTNPACSDICGRVSDRSLALPLRKAVVLSIRTLYADCLGRRCAPALSHNHESQGARLNITCFMFWDVTPLLHWHRDPDRIEMEHMVLDVLRAGLELPNPACQESALHGLGHFHMASGRRSDSNAIIAGYLERTAVSPALLRYAQSAATGTVQ